MNAVVLRVFTGPHMGAELVLEPGNYVLGSRLDCDIILQDSSVAPRHLELMVEAHPARIRVVALEGQAVVAGEPLAPDAALPPRTPCFVGLTCFAWASPGMAAADAAADVAADVAVAEEPDQDDIAREGAGSPASEDAATDRSDLAEVAELADFSDLPDLREAWDEVALALHAVLHPAIQPGSTEIAAQAARAAEEAARSAQEQDEASAEGAAHTARAGAASPATASGGEAGAGAGTTENTVLTLDRLAANNVTLDRLSVLAAQRARSRQKRRIWLLCLLVLVLGGLVFKAQDAMNTPPQSLEKIRQILTEAGFAALEVSASENGPRISGRLPDDFERGRLVRLVQRMHLPVYLHVQVDGDMTQALRTAFNSRELFPKVWAQRQGETMDLYVSGYMKDGVVEAWALAGAREDLPWLAAFLQPETGAAPGKLVRSIVHAEGVETVLRPALEAAGLGVAGTAGQGTARAGAVQISYLPGTVEISGIFDVEGRNRLDRVLAEVSKQLGVPVVFQVRESLPQLPQAVAGKTTGMHEAPEFQTKNFGAAGNAAPSGASGPAAAPLTAPSTFRVTSVTMTPMRFITLESGERVFEGGMLPGGYTLETIDPSRLVLRRDGQNTPLTLRGSDER